MICCKQIVVIPISVSDQIPQKTLHVQTKYNNTCECVMIRLTDNTMLLVTARYSPLTSCSDDTIVVWVGMLWRIVRWRWRIHVELIVQHVSTVCQTTVNALTNISAYYSEETVHTLHRLIIIRKSTALILHQSRRSFLWMRQVEIRKSC